MKKEVVTIPEHARRAPSAAILRPLPRANVLGVGVHATYMREAVERIVEAVESNTRGYVCLTGVHGVMEAQDNARLKRTLNRAFLNLPDGMPTVWTGRVQGHRSMRRVFGPDLMLEVCRLSALRGYTQFLYGGRPGVADALAGSLSERFPGLHVVGTYTPPFRELRDEEVAALRALVARLSPDIFWVGLSTPKQEQFMDRFGDCLDTKVMLGVGAAFDYHTGRISDAPRWIKESGLQWAHRLAQDPRRLWKRYAKNNPRFVVRILAQALIPRRYSLANARPDALPSNVGLGADYCDGFDPGESVRSSSVTGTPGRASE